MIIDFHTHIFPDKIAAATIHHLELLGGIQATTDGTVSGLKRSMNEAGISYSIALPVVTKPSQFHSINEYAAKVNGVEGIISFGGIHPDTMDYKAELDEIKQLGLKGIKLHPDYQNTFIDDDKYIHIIRYALELGLVIVIHAGIDVGFPEVVHCTPERGLHMLKQVDDVNKGKARIIFAHMGGYGSWNQVEEMLVGQNILFDISYSLGYIKEEQLIRIIRKHGADKVLFATDCPWGEQKEILKKFQELQMTKKEEDAILYQNALRLLNIT